MSTDLIQFNAGEHVLGGQNIAEAVCTEGDAVFNESYIVAGGCLKARKIYAAYNLTVHGDMIAEEVTVHGSLIVTGNLEAGVLDCRGRLVCTGEMRAGQLAVDGFAVADSLAGDSVRTGKELFVRTTVDVNQRLETAGLLVAAEGIMGAGTLRAPAAVAGEYVEFDGECFGGVWELSSMGLTQGGRPQEPSGAPARLADRLTALSRTGRITNLKDFLLVFWAGKEFSEDFPFCSELLERASEEAAALPFHAAEIGELSDALYVLSRYHRELPLDFEDCADKIFSSIGLRYETVRRAMEVRQ